MDSGGLISSSYSAQPRRPSKAWLIFNFSFQLGRLFDMRTMRRTAKQRGASTRACRVPTHRDAWRLAPTLRLGVHVCALLLSLPLSAAVVDRVAVVVGKTVITESEVLDEVRLTEFLNGQPLELGPQQRR